MKAFYYAFKLSLPSLKGILNAKGYLVCSPISVLNAAFDAGYLPAEDRDVLFSALNIHALLACSFDELYDLLPEHFIKNEVTQVLVELCQRFEGSRGSF